MATWLKLIGASDDPLPDNWLSERPDLREEVGFSRKARVEIGEDLVLYAIPQSRIVGLAKVVSHPIKCDEQSRWPWRSKIDLRLGIADYSRAPTLDDIAPPGGRDLTKSVRQQSHIELTWKEWERAKAELQARYDPAKGDFPPAP